MKFPRWLLIPIVLILLCFATAALLMCTSPGVPVLNYHQVEDKDGNPLTLYCDQFDQQMAYLAEEGYHTITLDEMMDAAENGTPLPEKPVVITLDDGYVDNYEYAYPILKKYGFKATIFLINDFTGVYPNYLTWEQIREMQDSGLIDFESHTMTHANLSELTSCDELHHEIADSREALSKKLGKEIDYIAYPGGRVTDAVEEVTRDAGYRGGFTVHYGLSTPTEGVYQMDRIPIFGCNTHTMTRFKLRLAFAPLIAPFEDLRLTLRAWGLALIGNYLPIP